jgi:hypothetical protein
MELAEICEEHDVDPHHLQAPLRRLQRERIVLSESLTAHRKDTIVSRIRSSSCSGFNPEIQ